MAEEDYYEVYYEEEKSHTPIFILLLIAIVSFYFQALITEERFVPALNVIAKKLQFSDDVAGATLMAAGASSPELFAALVSIFITHSALGIGTIVGSEVFNSLVISGGAILATKNRRLVLDPTIFIRDASFYTVAIIFLYIAISERGEEEEDGKEYVNVTPRDTYYLFGSYIVYVLVCANFDRILHFMNISPGREKDESYQCHYEAFDSEKQSNAAKNDLPLRKVSTDMPFVRSCGGREPFENFLKSSSNFQISNTNSLIAELFSESQEEEEDSGFTCADGLLQTRQYIMDTFAPSVDIDGIDDIEKSSDGSVSLYLWQRSTFYDKARIDMNAWQLKWFTFGQNTISSLPFRDAEENPSFLPHFSSFDADQARLLLKTRTEERHYVLLAPSEKNFFAALRRMEHVLNCEDRDLEPIPSEETDVLEVHESLIKLPQGSTRVGRMMHIITFPVKAFIHFLVPDVRNAGVISVALKAVVAAIVCICCLILGSYAMVSSLEELSQILRIPESVVGATVSAAGTSLPNYVSSQIAASLGLGNMAVSNLLGSNTFNILVGLGFPWLLYTTMYGIDYSEIPAEGINESMIAMLISHVVFTASVLISGFELRTCHAYVYFTLYVVFLGYIIGDSLVD